MSDHATRKGDHLDLCSTDEVQFRGKTNLLEQVTLVHNALPDLDLADIRLATTVAGKPLGAPLVIAAMTGGVDQADAINRDLASVAQELGLGFGFGSMRPLLSNPEAPGYQVRDVAPDALVLGNLGLVQARESGPDTIQRLIDRTGCDGLCVHLNPAMEIIQPGGDTDFREGLSTIELLVRNLTVPVIVKETGCGLSRSVGRRLVDVGVTWVDVSGAGGTSWVGVETLRARAKTRELGELYWDWGIPTAASVAQLSGLGLNIIATGGVQNGLDIARAMGLGAAAGGMARPLLMAWNDGGREGALGKAQEVIEAIRLACLLTGSPSAEALQQCSLVIGSDLAPWVPTDAPLHARLASRAAH
jgi:isopentenyl-diphosphate delta-isomerase